MRVVVLGSGNVAYTVSVALSSVGAEVVQIVARNQAEGRALAEKLRCGFSDSYDNLAPADLYLIAVSDSAVDIVSNKLNVPHGAVVAHTAGSIEMDVLKKHANRAVFYPLQTFSKGREVDFAQIPIMIEATTPQVLAVVRQLAEMLSRDVRVATSEQRCRVHLAAVFACNFTNHMYVIAESLLNGSGMDFDLLKPLIRETTDKMLASHSPIATQTGPAVRNDFKTKNKHSEMLVQQPQFRTLYTNLSSSIWEISKKI